MMKEYEDENENEANYDKCMINLIHDNLYLSDWEGASKLYFLEELGIEKIISLGTEEEMQKYVFHERDGLEYMKIIIDDIEKANISSYFDTNRFIFESLKSSKRVLIHCNKGISRSPTIAIAYFIKVLNLSYEEALYKIKEIRPFVKPNKGFINQIIKRYI